METSEVFHWIIVTFCIVICITGIIGNSLVVYFVHKTHNTGAFRHLSRVVRNLAINDFLYGLIGAPLLMARWTWGNI